MKNRKTIKTKLNENKENKNNLKKSNSSNSKLDNSEKLTEIKSEKEELNLLNKKRKLSDFSKSEENEYKDFKKKITIDPIVFKITSNEEIKENEFWKLIKEEFSKKNSELKVNYCTFKNKKGFLTILYRCDEEDKIKFNKELKVNDYILNIEKAEGDDLIDFWKYNESFYVLVNNLKIEKKNINSNYHNKELLKEKINLGSKEFNNILDIKKKAKNIVLNTFDNQHINEDSLKFILDVLKFHPKYEEKIKDMDFISVGKNNKYVNTRCFVIVKKNGVIEDFSIQKCIEQIALKYC